MKGSIKPTWDAVCSKCNGKKFSTKEDDFLKIKLPKCIACDGAPSKLRVSKVIPHLGRGVLKDFYRDMEGNLLDSPLRAITMLNQLNGVIQSNPSAFSAYEFKNDKVYTFNKILVSYLEFILKRTNFPQDHDKYLTPAGYRLKLGSINNHLMPHFGKLDVRYINKKAIEKFSDSYTDRLRARDMALSELKVILRYCLEELEIIQYMPPFPKIKQSRRKRIEEIPTIDTQVKIINNIKEHMFRCMWIIAAVLAKRPSEVRAYKVKDVDLDYGVLTTRRHFSKGINGDVLLDGRKCIKISNDFGEIKNYLDENLLKLITPYVKNRDGEEFLFTFNGNPVRQELFSSKWTDSCRELGLNYRPYDGTKHATLTNMLREGHTMEQARALAGHADSRMTESYALLTGIETRHLTNSEVFALKK